MIAKAALRSIVRMEKEWVLFKAGSRRRVTVKSCTIITGLPLLVVQNRRKTFRLKRWPAQEKAPPQRACSLLGKDRLDQPWKPAVHYISAQRVHMGRANTAGVDKARIP